MSVILDNVKKTVDCLLYAVIYQDRWHFRTVKWTSRQEIEPYRKKYDRIFKVQITTFVLTSQCLIYNHKQEKCKN